jgi:hypothetical protein
VQLASGHVATWERRRDEAAAAAIAAGATWQQLADALGVTRSAAYQRFHR